MTVAVAFSDFLAGGIGPSGDGRRRWSETVDIQLVRKGRQIDFTVRNRGCAVFGEIEDVFGLGFVGAPKLFERAGIEDAHRTTHDVNESVVFQR